MKATYFAALTAVAALLTGCAGLGTRDTGAVDAAAAERRILVTIVEPSRGTVALPGAPAERYARRRGYATHAAVERTLDALARDYALERVDGWPIASLGVYCEVYEVADEGSVDVALAALGGDVRVDAAQRMQLFETLTESGYDDPYAVLQWTVPQLSMPEAHRIATGRGVLVALIDSGVDTHHPDLAGRVRVSRNLVAGAEPADGEVHGTAVAGIIASVANNHEGIVGVAPDVSLAALRACWSSDAGASAARCSSFTLARALETALDLGPGVINLSLGGPPDPLLSRLLDAALRRGVIVVAAADPSEGGNTFPASHRGVLVARAADGAPPRSDEHRLVAPGTDILTTTPRSGYAFLSGNSLAAAHVSGVVALLLQLEPGLGSEEAAALLAHATTYATGTVSINACLALERLVEVHACPSQIEIASF